MSTLLTKLLGAAREGAHSLILLAGFFTVALAGALLHKALMPICEMLLSAAGPAAPIVIAISAVIVLAFHNKA